MNLIFRLLLFFSAFIGVQLGYAAVNVNESFARVDSDLQHYDDTVRIMKREFAQYPENTRDTKWVKQKLKHMVDVDQFTRGQFQLPVERAYTDAERDYFYQRFMPRSKQVDVENTADVKQLLKIYPWFVVSKFGKEADRNAWLLVQHADYDHEFQKSVLIILEALYPKGETLPGNYAYLFDRVAASWFDLTRRTLQRFGTQGECFGKGKWKPLPMEDPANLDDRRNRMGLEPMADYLGRVRLLCN